MGLDLSLLPFEADHERLSFSHSVLSVDRTEIVRVVWESLRDAGETTPDHFSSYLCREGEIEETHYGVTTTDPYGNRVRCVSVEELLAFREHPGVYQDPRNRAVWAYLAELPEKTRVALFWH